MARREMIRVDANGNCTIMRRAPLPGGGGNWYDVQPLHYRVRTPQGWLLHGNTERVFLSPDDEKAATYPNAPEARKAAMDTLLVLPWLHWEVVPVWPED